MSAEVLDVSVGARLWCEGAAWTVVELDGTTAVLRSGDRIRRFHAPRSSGTPARWRNRPTGVLGRLHADRPGQYVVLDTIRLDVFTMEPVTGRWLNTELTVAMDLHSRCMLGLTLRPVVPSRIGVRSMTTVAYFSPRLVWRQTCPSTPITATASKRTGSAISTPGALGQDGVVGGVPGHVEGLGQAGDGQVLSHQARQRPGHRRAGLLA